MVILLIYAMLVACGHQLEAFGDFFTLVNSVWLDEAAYINYYESLSLLFIVPQFMHQSPGHSKREFPSLARSAIAIYNIAGYPGD